MSNSLFMNGDPTWSNACVGENGFIDYLTYAEGYSKASNLLLNHVLDQKGRDIDSFIYPIVFNMRHSIELRLKGAIIKIEELAEIKNVALKNFDLAKNHDISKIWIDFQDKSEKLDSRFIGINSLLNQTIIDMGKVDSTGQVFRYPVDENKKKHLIEVRIINCRVLKTKFNNLEANLNKLDRLTNLLIEEYKKGTFTSKLSRNQIFNLAKSLPKYENWRTFLDKKELCSQYVLSSNDLTKALKLIKKNYETSGFIGLKLDLIYLKDDFILELCSIWTTNINPDFKSLYSEDMKSINLGDVFENSMLFTEIIKEQELKEEAYQGLSTKLDIDSVADLWALFYLSRDGENYSEMYFQFFEHFRKEIVVEDNLIHSFDHVFSKASFLDELIRSLYFLQQNELAENIVNMLKLESCFKFIDKARDRSLFKKWEYLDYSL